MDTPLRIMEYGEHGRCTARAKSTNKRCERAAVGEHRKCDKHGGATPTKKENPAVGAPEGNTNAKNNAGNPDPSSNATKHHLHSSIETFLKDADRRHIDTYHAVFEALCSRFERLKGRIPDRAHKQELKHVAKDMATQDIATEYIKEHAVNNEFPLTERQLRDIDGPMEVEEIAKEWDLIAGLKRENRLRMKDMGIYENPDKQLKGLPGEDTIAEILSNNDTN